MSTESKMSKLLPGSIDPGAVTSDGVPEFTTLEIQMGLASIQDDTTRMVVQANRLQCEGSRWALIRHMHYRFINSYPDNKNIKRAAQDQIPIMVVDEFLGRGEFNDSIRARRCKEPRKSWRPKYGGYYEDLYRLLGALYSDGLRVINNQLRDKETP